MNIVIWGNGGNGRKCYKLFLENLKNDKVICFVDNDKDKLDDYYEVPIVTVGTLRLLCANGLVDKIVIPGYEPHIYRSIFVQLYKLGIDYRKMLFYAEPEYFADKFETGIVSFEELEKLCENEIPLIGAMEYEISEKCNLNCKRCNHYSNIFENGQMVEIEQFSKDIRTLKSRVYNVKRFKILGGEPLMHPRVDLFVRSCRDVFPNAYIAIVTNGILVPQMSNELIDAIKEANVVVEISAYPPTKEKIAEITEYLEQKGIRYRIFRNGDLFGAYLTTSGENNPMDSMTKCYAQVCHAMKNGYLYKCASGLNIDVLNQRYNIDLPMEKKELERNGQVIPAKEMFDYLVNPVALCCYCTDFEWHNWEQTRNDAKLEDWIAR